MTWRAPRPRRAPPCRRSCSARSEVKRALAGLVLLVAFALAFSPLLAAVSGGVDGEALHLVRAERRALSAHLLVALSAALTALVLGAPFAILVGGTRSPLRRALIALGALALACPHYLAAEALIDLVGPA